jgi:hypothetical protein
MISNIPDSLSSQIGNVAHNGYLVDKASFNNDPVQSKILLEQAYEWYLDQSDSTVRTLPEISEDPYFTATPHQPA